MAKEIKARIKIQIPAGQATPAPPVGPTLAQHGLNIAEFCKKFNDKTKDMQGFNLPVAVTVYEDRSYGFKIKQPLTVDLLKKAAGIEKGSGEPNKTKVGKISKADLRKIAERKMADLNTDDIEQAEKIITATAKNMGIEITG
jgi:large subunit ribosomal protein L11